MTGVVHFVLGESAASSLRQAFPGAHVAVMTDWFSYGRCRFDGAESTHEWLRARHQWWVDEAGDESLEALNSGPNAIANLEDGLKRAEEAVVWIADGATERLHLCWLVATLSSRVRLRVAIPPNQWPGRDTQTIGIVRSENLAKTPPRDLSGSAACTSRRGPCGGWMASQSPAPEHER